MWTDKLRFSLSLVELVRNICSTTKTCLNFTLVSSEMFINVSKAGLCRLLLGIKTSGRFGSVCWLVFFFLIAWYHFVFPVSSALC